MYCYPLDYNFASTDSSYELTCKTANQMNEDDRRIFEQTIAFRLCRAAAVQDVAGLNEMTDKSEIVMEGELVLFWIYAARVVAHLAGLERDGEGAVLDYYSIVIEGFGNAIDSCAVADMIESLL